MVGHWASDIILLWSYGLDIIKQSSYIFKQKWFTEIPPDTDRIVLNLKLYNFRYKNQRPNYVLYACFVVEWSPY